MKNFMPKHENYELLNLAGYGLAKFGGAFVRAFGAASKSAFYRHFVDARIAENENVVKNRQDLFDPFFDNGRKGWWQKGDAYKHRKTSIDALYGELSGTEFADVVKLLLERESGVPADALRAKNPLAESRFKKLQETGHAAEHYFMAHFREIGGFDDGVLEDARHLGDGYDFQVQLPGNFFLAEIKGVRNNRGNVRLTENEHRKARQHAAAYGLVVVSSLNDAPKMTAVFDPVANLQMTEKTVESIRREYHTRTMAW